MSSQPEPSTQEVVAGLVERVTYHNAENGFCVLRAKARGHRDVWAMPQPLPPASGSRPPANGSTTAPTASSSKPGSCAHRRRLLLTVEKYLSSGMIRGVGPVYAKKL